MARATLTDVEAFVSTLPEVTEGTRYGNRTWFVRTTSFVWERPLRQADVKRWTDGTPPMGTLLAFRTDGLEEKEAILGSGIPGVLTIAHFENYPALLVELDVVSKKDLRDRLLDAWLAAAPEPLARQYLASRRSRPAR